MPNVTFFLLQRLLVGRGCGFCSLSFDHIDHIPIEYPTIKNFYGLVEHPSFLTRMVYFISGNKITRPLLATTDYRMRSCACSVSGLEYHASCTRCWYGVRFGSHTDESVQVFVASGWKYIGSNIIGGCSMQRTKTDIVFPSVNGLPEQFFDFRRGLTVLNTRHFSHHLVG